MAADYGPRVATGDEQQQMASGGGNDVNKLHAIIDDNGTKHI